MVLTRLLPIRTSETPRWTRSRRRRGPRQQVAGIARRGYSRALIAEALEDRMLLTAYIVDTTADDPSAGQDVVDGFVSLREAITATNTNDYFGDAPAGSSDEEDLITFDMSLIDQTTVLGGEELTVSGNLSLTGLGRDDLAISGNSASRVFSIVADAAVKISDVTITGGVADLGGGISNEGTLTVAGCTLWGNKAPSDGAWNTSENGGGIWNNGTLTVTDSKFSENYSWSNGGAIWNEGTLDVTNGDFSYNKTGGNGGGVANHYGGTAKITGSKFEWNSAATGAAIDSYGAMAGLPSDLQVSGSVFRNNDAGTGGAIWNDSPADISNSRFETNHARGWGGAIANGKSTMTVRNCTFTDNSSALYSGAIDNTGYGAGTLRVFNSTFAGNSTGQEGGAIENYFGVLEIVNSTISGNSSNQMGGGIWNLGQLSITNSTIVGNRAAADGKESGDGGGLWHISLPGRYPDPVLNNTILAGNVRGIAGSDQPDDISGTVDPSSSHNLIGDAATSGGLTHGDDKGNIVGNAGTGTIDITTVLALNLADHGGLTRTHALVRGGPAVNAGDNSKAVDADGNALVYDQRDEGFTRIYDGTVDIGAFENQPLSVQIDVKPGGDLNSINLANIGVIAVAILTTDAVDAALVDASTVLFAGASAVHSSLEDVDGDGDLDLILHFQTQETNLAELYALLLADDINGDSVLDSNHQTVALSLTGQTSTDEYFEGFDEIDLFLAGKNLRDLLEELAAGGAI